MESEETSDDAKQTGQGIAYVRIKVMWRELDEFFFRSCLLSSLASDVFDETDYIRDFETFLKNSSS